MRLSKILFYTIASMTFASCQKLVEIKETDLIAGDIALKTVKNNEQGVIGAYGTLNIEMSYNFNSVVSDELKVGEFYSFGTVHEWNFGTRDVPIRDAFTAITGLYRVVDRVNRVLKALPNATASSSADEALRSRLRGEALFLRALSHFELYRYYSNSSVGTDLAMPYMEEPTISPAARITVSAYFQKLKADLSAAKSLLPVYSNAIATSNEIYRATDKAVSGLQARVALYLKEYSDAINFATEYINAIPLASRSNFTGIWTDANNNEQAFKLSRTVNSGSSAGPVTTGRIGIFWRGISAGGSNIGTVTWAPSDKIWSAYDQTNDIRFSAYLKDEPLLTNVGRGSRVIAKYAGTGYGTANENVADVKVFRTGEMYLIRAESKAETNDLVGAAADLNALRAQRISGYLPVVFSSKTDAIDQILEERFKELAFEGHRFFDAKRRNLPINRLVSDAPSSTTITLPAGNFRFLLPIPGTEIDANPLMQQNPGYGN